MKPNFDLTNRERQTKEGQTGGCAALAIAVALVLAAIIAIL